MVQFFIHRPVFAWVLAIVTMLAGAFAYTRLPVAQYPDIAPTTIRINASYSGATAEAVQNSVTRVIEGALTGLDGLLYMESTSRQGSASVTLTFDESVAPVDAQNEVQSKVGAVENRLPERVRTSGLRYSRSSSSILMTVALVSPDGRYTTLQLGDILQSTMETPIGDTEGVGGTSIFGSGYAMRIWLDPLKLAEYQLTPTDVTQAVQAQNTTVSVGSLGARPAVSGQQFTATITAQSQLTSVAEFERIFLKNDERGAAVLLGDVAEVGIEAASYGVNSRFNGLNAAGFGINLATGANAVDTAAAVRATMDRVAPSLPDGVEIQYAYDTSPFVKLSIDKVYLTLIEAVILVLAVILIFLQKFRATFIPLIAVPVVLAGTFVVLFWLGYSVNTLTMFAMVLAIGLLVDDAIVVVENVERVIETEHLSPMEATEKSMKQITGALIGIALVLSAVFLPMAFMPGSTGVIYRQFAVTIISAMVLSALVALILSPALCASMLKPAAHGRPVLLARWFNAVFDAFTRFYGAVVRGLLKVSLLVMLALGAITWGAYELYTRLPASFLPQEDQGVLIVQVNLTEGSTSPQTEGVVEEIERYLLTEEIEGVESTFGTMGFGFGGGGQNTAMIFVKLRDFDLRHGRADLTAPAIAGRGNAKFGQLRAGRVSFNQPPSIPGLGNTAGFSFFLTDQGGSGLENLRIMASQLEEMALTDGRVQNLRVSGNSDEAVLRINIDQQKAESFGLSVGQVNQALSVIFSGSQVNDFNLNGELRPVIVQGAPEFRMQPEDIDSWFARNSKGEMVPFPAFLSTSWISTPPALARFAGAAAISVSGQPAPGLSTGEAMAVVEELVAQLPGGFGVNWTGISYQERQSGNQAPFLYALSVLVVFLCLAALYESWSIPFSVMLAVPVGVLGAMAAAFWAGQSNDVYFKVGILTTIGLASKNAILIVEFARALEAQGKSLIDATVEAAMLRLRPILMTSLAFMLGVLPLVLAEGAGAKAQNAIGIGVLGGMTAATFIGIFMVPSFYVVVRRLTDRSVRQGRSARTSAGRLEAAE